VEISIFPPEGFWKGGSYKFSVTLSNKYPEIPPEIRCETQIFHPHVHPCTGHVNVHSLFRDEGWSEQRSLHDIIFGLARIFAEPMTENPLNLEAAELLQKGEKEFGEVVRKMQGGVMKE